MKNNMNKILGLIVFFLVILTRFLFAQGSVDELRPVDLDGDGQPEKVSLIYSEPDDYGNCSVTLKVESYGKIYTVFLKEGFIADTTRLKKLILSDKIRPFIVVDAVLNKSMNRWIYSFDKGHIKEELVVFSNFPSILEKDVDHDGVNEIVAKNNGSIDRTYKWNGVKFYDSTPRIPESRPSPEEEF